MAFPSMNGECILSFLGRGATKINQFIAAAFCIDYYSSNDETNQGIKTVNDEVAVFISLKTHFPLFPADNLATKQ